MAFQEFYCDYATGANINAGDDKTLVTSTNGDWGNAAANRFTAASGTPFSGVAVGDYASVYLDGATLAVYIGRVTAINGGGASLDISSTIKAGTAPSTGATGRSCTVGGKWKGPNAAENFPFGFVAGTMTKVTTNEIPRVNLKNGTSYLISGAITHGATGPVVFQGYTTTPGDGGLATIDAQNNAITILTVTGTLTELEDIGVTNNDASGSGNGIVLNASYASCRRCVAWDIRANAFSATNAYAAPFIECEAYNWNVAAGTNYGFTMGNEGGQCIRCIAHDAPAAGSRGFNFGPNSAGGYYCIADTCASDGFYLQDYGKKTLIGCDAYNNGGDGIEIADGRIVYIENCNLIKNGGYGINVSVATHYIGHLVNNGFGSGTQANTSGAKTTSIKSLVEIGSVTYGTDLLPWVDAPNGDFRVNLAAAKGAGRSSFRQTAASYAGAVGYPDIGSNQHQDAGGSSNPFGGSCF